MYKHYKPQFSRRVNILCTVLLGPPQERAVGPRGQVPGHFRSQLK